MKKKQLSVLLVLFLIVFVMIGIFLYVFRMYRSVGLSLVKEFDKPYEYSGKLLLSQGEDDALRVVTVGKTEFESLPLTTVDLTPFGFKGESLSYYTVETIDDYGVKHSFLYTASTDYEGLWPVLQPDRLVYKAKDGKKYCIHPSQDLCYPMFSDSIEGVDPYGTEVLAFSGNGSYAISLSGETVTVYHTDPMDQSLRVVDVKDVSLSEFGKNVRFGAFLNDTDAYFTVSGKKGDFLVALNCKTGEVVKSLLDEKGTYGETLNRLYAQRFDKEEKEELRVTWSHLLLGEEVTTPKISDFNKVILQTVSPAGTYAVGKGEKNGKEEFLCMSKKRVFSLSSVLAEEDKIQSVDFIYENLILVNVENGEGQTRSLCYKVCF